MDRDLFGESSPFKPVRKEYLTPKLREVLDGVRKAGAAGVSTKHYEGSANDLQRLWAMGLLARTGLTGGGWIFRVRD